MSNKVYQIITDKMVTSLEQGKIPWVKPWNTEQGAPKALLRKEYTGVNSLLLSPELTGFNSPYWVTYKDIQTLGGRLKKGSKASMAVFFKFYSPKGEQDKKIPILRYYNVFNVEQVDGIEDHLPKPKKTRKANKIKSCEQVVKGYKDRPKVSHGGSRAYYRPSTDEIQMPPQENFKDDEAYYQTLFHEFIHSTGHQDRLNRKEVTGSHGFGSGDYSKEELVAELGACFLCADTGIDPDIENSKAYIQGWISKLKNDPKLIVTASSRAGKAVEYIKNNK